MGALVLIFDVDGFMGKIQKKDCIRPDRTLLIPREASFLSYEFGKKDQSLPESLYFTGGMSPSFIEDNRTTLNYQANHIHGLPLDITAQQSALYPRIELSEGGCEIEKEISFYMVTRLTSAMTDRISSDIRHIILIHKGGPENQWLIEVGNNLKRRFPLDIGIIDLNDFGCPKVDTQLKSYRTRDKLINRYTCGPAVHNRIAAKGQMAWAKHCPQIECLVLKEWVDAHFAFIGANEVCNFTRHDRITPDDAYKYICQRIQELVAVPDFHGQALDDKHFRKRLNWVQKQILQSGNYLPIQDIHLILKYLSYAH